MNVITFEKAREKLYKIISLSLGCSFNEIYEYAYDIYQNHDLTRGFLLNEGYDPKQIKRAKHQYITLYEMEQIILKKNKKIITDFYKNLSKSENLESFSVSLIVNGKIEDSFSLTKEEIDEIAVNDK